MTAINDNFLKARVPTVTVEGIALFLKAGADINAVDADGDTFLHYAVAHCREEVVRFLLSEGADVSVKNRAGETPEGRALGRENVLAALRAAGEGRASCLGFLLLEAVKNNNSGEIRALMKKGARVLPASACGGSSALMIVAQDDTPGELTALISVTDDIDDFDARGMTALALALERGHFDNADLLQAAGADINAQKIPGETPPAYAACFLKFSCRNREIFQPLVLKYAPDLDLTFFYEPAGRKMTLIDALAFQVAGMSPAAAMPIEENLAELEFWRLQTQWEARKAAYARWQEARWSFARQAAKASALRLRHRIDLGYRARRGEEQTVCTPQESPVLAAPPARDPPPRTAEAQRRLDHALWFAVRRMDERRIAACLALGANPNTAKTVSVNVRSDQQTPVLMALFLKAFDIADRLLAHGGDINAQAVPGVSEPPLLACLARDIEKGETSRVSYLIERGADLRLIFTYQGMPGQTFLSYLVKRENALKGRDPVTVAQLSAVRKMQAMIQQRTFTPRPKPRGPSFQPPKGRNE